MTAKIPWYVPKWAEEVARAVGVAVFLGAVALIADKGIPNDSTGWITLAGALAPIAWAALRAALNKTPLTPPDATDTPLAPPPGPTP